MTKINAHQDTLIYSISMLNQMAHHIVNQHFGFISVTGEISNLSRPSSGHVYFSLKDATAQIRCALFRFQHKEIGFTLEQGQQVIVQAQVSIYEARGDFQLIVHHVQLAGTGKLQLAFEQLKKKLDKMGFFDERNKKSLPAFPMQIGVITSPTAAALRDILKVLAKRFASIPVVIYPTAVQGETAAVNIASAISLANHRAECDVLIVARGGGSLEDLWPFNEEIVAQAIFESTIPIVTGVGHQTDFTIADFVADYRAPTPSAAAETVTPDCAEYVDQLSHYFARLSQAITSQLKSHQTHLFHLQKRLQHPREKLQQQAQQLDQLENRLQHMMRIYLEKNRGKIAQSAQLLSSLNPLSILQRGYSVTRNKTTNRVISHANDVKKGDVICTMLQEGEIESVVI